MRQTVLALLVISNVAVLPTLGVDTECSLEDVKGLLCTVFTPTYEDGAVDTSKIPAYAQYLADNNADGVIVASTWGEGPTMNTSDNQLLLDAWMAVAPSLGLLVISEIGAEPLPDAQEMATYSEELGVDALIVLPPVYYRPKTPEELVYYLQFISDAAPNTPIIYDHFPEYSDVEVDMDEFFELATDEIPNFKGVKSNEFDVALSLQRKVNDDQRIYVADSIRFAAAVLMGFEGFVLSELSYAPDLVTEILENGQNGNLTETRESSSELLVLLETISDDDVDRIAAEKTTASLITGIDMGPVRPPLVPLTEVQIASLSERLESENYTLAGYA